MIKKTILLTVLLFASYAHADYSFQAISSTKTADAVISDSSCFFKGMLVQPDGTNDVTITLYDNASAASGSKVIATMTFAGDGGPQALTIPVRIKCTNGIYADITTSGTVEYSIFYAGR